MVNRSKTDPHIAQARSVPSCNPNTVTVGLEEIVGEQSSESGQACKPSLIGISCRLC